jgi:hypothetical protein
MKIEIFTPGEAGKDLEGYSRDSLDLETNIHKFTLKTEVTRCQPVGNLSGIRNGCL